MAVRENQGLQIALIVFVMLTIMLSVTTFLFFRNYQYEQQRVREEQKKATDAQTRMGELQAERDDFARYIGFPASEKKQAVDEAWTKDVAEAEALGIAKLPDDQKNYRKLIEGLKSVVKSQNTQLAKKDSDLREAKATFDQKTAEYETEKKKISDEKEKAVQEYLAERTRMTDELASLTETKKQLENQKIAKDKELAEYKAQAEGKITQLEKDFSAAQTQVAKRGQEINELSGKFSVGAMPDGKIVWVNQRDNTVYINLGSADRLRKRISFSVFDPATTDVSAIKTQSPDVSTAIKKGSIEVINVTDLHMAECRILEHSVTNPMLPGDLIYTPVWRPGQEEHFALVGFLDLDGDKLSDRAKVRDLIRLNGGVVDAETDEKGNVSGAITSNTRYLVRGNTDLREGVSPAGDTKLIDDAGRFGVESVALSKFIEMMGYSPRGIDARLAPGEETQAPPAGTPSGMFRPRSPPARGKTGGAF